MAYDTVSSSTEQSASARPRLSVAGRVLNRFVPEPLAGSLKLTLPNGDVIRRRGEQQGPEAEFSIQSWRELVRMLLDGNHAFADGYLDGQWTTPDLFALLSFFAVNERAFDTRTISSRLTSLRNRLSHQRRANTRRGSRRNIAAHYDLGNAFYRLWLDDAMNYSSALYDANETLEAAQQAKLDRIMTLMDLSGGERVLEIGCGWGALAERLLRKSDCSVVGITLSLEQLAYAKARLAPEAAGGRAEFSLKDYRDLDGTYDRIASIEMVEAVGERYWPLYFDTLRSSLTPGGIAVVQAITIEDWRFKDYRSRPDFIQRYIFPGGMLPTKERLQAQAERSGLVLVDRQDFGASYARTLEEWRRRFLEAWRDIAPLGFDARFRRMWEYYLTYCEVGFRAAMIDVSLFKFRRSDEPA